MDGKNAVACQSIPRVQRYPRHTIVARHSATIRAQPEASPDVLMNDRNRVIRQTIFSSEIVESLTIVASYSTVRTEPQYALGILVDCVYPVVWEAILRSIVRVLLSIVAENTVSTPKPHDSFTITMDRTNGAALPPTFGLHRGNLLSVIAAETAHIHAEPERIIHILVDGPDRARSKTVLGGEICKRLSVIVGYPAIGTEPERAVFVLMDRPDVITCETIFGGEIRESGAVVPGNSTTVGSQPQRAIRGAVNGSDGIVWKPILGSEVGDAVFIIARNAAPLIEANSTDRYRTTLNQLDPDRWTEHQRPRARPWA